MLATFIGFLLFTTIHCMPVFDTTNNQIDTTETSTVTKQTVADTTATRLSENNTMPTPNVTSESVNRIVTTSVPVLTINGTIQSVKVMSSNGSYYNETNIDDTTPTETTTIELGLSDDLIAGIVIAVLALICCCAFIAICINKSGHWEITPKI